MKKTFVFFIIFTLFSNSAYEQCILKDGVNIVFGTQPCSNNYPLELVLNDDFGTSGYTLNDLFLNWNINYQGVQGGFDFIDTKEWYANTGVTPSINVEHNIEVSNGTLKLIAQKEEPPIEGTFCTSWIGGNCSNYDTESFDYSSALLTSKIPYKYGKFEIKCKLPAGHGFFPAFWLMGGPIWNEIDIFEFSDYSTTTDLMTVHYDINGDGDAAHAPESCGEGHGGSDFAADFHKFTLIWNEYYIEWYVDDVLKRKVPRFYYTSYTLNQDVNCENVNNDDYYYRKEEAVFPDEPMNLIVNLAVQVGNFAPDGTTAFPNALEIEYIKIWQYENENACCIPYKLYEATDNLPPDTHVKDYIIAGNDAGIPNVSGNVTVQNGQSVTFTAGKDIDLKPGFIVQHGGHFIGKIEDCTAINQPGGNDIVVNNFPTEFTDKLFVSVNGATSYCIIVKGIYWPYNTYYIKNNMPINSDPVCVWDGTCNYNCSIYNECDKDRTVKIDFMNCDHVLSQSHDVHVNCSKAKTTKDSLASNSNPDSVSVMKNKPNDLLYFKMSPNPCKSYVQIDYSINSDNQIILDFYNITGNKQKEYILPCGKNSKILDISDLSNGVYSYRVYNGNDLIKKDKIVVIK